MAVHLESVNAAGSVLETIAARISDLGETFGAYLRQGRLRIR